MSENCKMVHVLREAGAAPGKGAEPERNLWQASRGLGRKRYLENASSELDRRPVTWPYLRRFLEELKPMRGHVFPAVALMPLAKIDVRDPSPRGSPGAPRSGT